MIQARQNATVVEVTMDHFWLEWLNVWEATSLSIMQGSVVKDNRLRQQSPDQERYAKKRKFM